MRLGESQPKCPGTSFINKQVCSGPFSSSLPESDAFPSQCEDGSGGEKVASGHACALIDLRRRCGRPPLGNTMNCMVRFCKLFLRYSPGLLWQCSRQLGIYASESLRKEFAKPTVQGILSVRMLEDRTLCTFTNLHVPMCFVAGNMEGY